MKRLQRMVLGVAAAALGATSAFGAGVLVSPGRAVFDAGDAGHAVVFQAESACRVEVASGGKQRVFVADRDGVWAITSVGSVAWQEQRWKSDDAWIAALLVTLDPGAAGVRRERGLPKSYAPPTGAKVAIPAVAYLADAKGVKSYSAGEVEVTRTSIGPLPQLAADAFSVPSKQRKGLAKLADATKGLFGSSEPRVSSTAGARGVTEEEKKLGTTYNFAAVEKIEAAKVDASEVDKFIQQGKLGGGS